MKLNIKLGSLLALIFALLIGCTPNYHDKTIKLAKELETPYLSLGSIDWKYPEGYSNEVELLSFDEITNAYTLFNAAILSLDQLYQQRDYYFKTGEKETVIQYLLDFTSQWKHTYSCGAKVIELLSDNSLVNFVILLGYIESPVKPNEKLSTGYAELDRTASLQEKEYEKLIAQARLARSWRGEGERLAKSYVENDVIWWRGLYTILDICKYMVDPILNNKE